jgi:hypothetical protein
VLTAFLVAYAVVAYLIFVSSTMAAVTDEISRKAWVCICTPLLVGMVCLNDYSFLSWMSVGGLLALIAAFASVFAYGMYALHGAITVNRQSSVVEASGHL